MEAMQMQIKEEMNVSEERLFNSICNSWFVNNGVRLHFIRFQRTTCLAYWTLEYQDSWYMMATWFPMFEASLL
jgi:hypothetical protein